MARPLIGVALGSGSARGLAHIGVLRGLAEAGIEPGVVCGTSIGALVGAAYVAGQLDALESWARSINLLDMLSLMDLSLQRGGVMQGTKLFKNLRNPHMDVRIEDLPKPFAAVATDFATGQEVWLQRGALLDAVRASLSLPGVFPPFKLGEHWLVDGGLVNPLPVSVCRALGAEVVVAVNLNGDLIGRNAPWQPQASERSSDRRRVAALRKKLSARLKGQLRGTAASLAGQLLGSKPENPGFFDVLGGAIYIMQDRITQSRIAADPPDVMVTPRLGHIRLLDFHRSEEVIDEGHRCVASMRTALQRALTGGRVR
jgi:NTE family protein